MASALGVFRVHPLIMTLGTSLVGVGILQVYQRTVIATGAAIPARCRGSPRASPTEYRTRSCCSSRWPR